MTKATKSATVPQTTLDQVLANVTELYGRDPAAFAEGMAMGAEHADYPAGRDYLGLVLGDLAVYESYPSTAAIQRAYRLNNPAYALGALVGIAGELPHGKFQNIVDF